MKDMQRPIKAFRNQGLNGQRGVTIVLVALLMFVFLGIAALAIDLSHLYVVGNELQNAADAGALAGARSLYNDNGTAVDPGANQTAYAFATANKALAETGGAIAVDVNWEEGQNEGTDVDVQRGHWCFFDGTFTANDSLAPVNLWGVSETELDMNPNFINAVKVVARRQDTPTASYFARIFGFEDFELAKEAVAYIGFAGTLAPGDADLPIAICSQSVTGDLSATECGTGYDCNIGRMLTDGEVKNSAAWTNFSQPCETASTTSMRPLLTCTESNPDLIKLGDSIGATNGVVDSIIGHPTQANLVDCWKSAFYDSDGDNEKDSPVDTDGDGWPDMPWNVNLPVVNCPDTQVSNCMETCGAVSANIVWILEKDNDIDTDAPKKMFNPLKNGLWENNSADGGERWNSFVDEFNLKDPHGQPAYYTDDPSDNDGFKKKTIYFLPDCTPHELKGITGGHNYGVLARIPVLVK